ncbi:MAG: peptide deformylase [Parcubacteria group bacterium]|nr:peptide deformylase [Parcubacteria group bacterium]
MSKFPSRIVRYGSPVLKKKAAEVQKPFADIRKLIAHMKRVMVESHGVGLAAPQIGIPSQVIIVQSPKKILGFVNPKIVRKSIEKSAEEEGCLSIPGIFIPVKRSLAVEIECETSRGERVQIKAKGLVARIFQHEIDHINGILITDHLGLRNRWKLRKALKQIRQ